MPAEFEVSSLEVEAIMCALPLVLEMEADTPEQNELNAICCASVGEKLTNRKSGFTRNDVRIMSVAVTAAVLLLSGKGNGFVPEIDPSWKKELSKHFFTLNRLAPILQDLAEQAGN